MKAFGAAILTLALGCLGGSMSRSHKFVRKDLKELKSPNRDDRLNAIRVLARRLGHELAVVPALIDATDDPDVIVQKAAAEALRLLLRRPAVPDSRTAWEEVWRRLKLRLKKENKLTPQERMRREKAKLKNDEGVLQMAVGNFGRAEHLLLEAVSEDPDNPMSWNNLGKCNANQGRLPDAIDRYLKALEMDPGYSQAHLNLADAYLRISKRTGSDRTYEALGYVENAIKLDRNKKDWAARWLKARILMYMAAPKEGAAVSEEFTVEKVEILKRASAAIDQAIKMAPNVAEVRKTAALIAYFRGLYYRAYKEVQKIYELGYEVEEQFLQGLWRKLRREYHNRGLKPPPMPNPSRKKPRKTGPPPALRRPYGDGSR